MVSFPDAIWNGTSEGRPEGALRPPSAEDWERLVAELRAVQSYVLSQGGGGPYAQLIPPYNEIQVLLDPEDQGPIGTLYAVEDTSQADQSTTINQNFVDLHYTIAEIVDVLTDAGLVTSS